MKELEITIAGAALNGKTTMSQWIKRELENRGVIVELDDIDSGSFDHRPPTFIYDCMHGLREHGLTVKIKTVQLPREVRRTST